MSKADPQFPERMPAESGWGGMPVSGKGKYSAVDDTASDSGSSLKNLEDSLISLSQTLSISPAQPTPFQDVSYELSKDNL